MGDQVDPFSAGKLGMEWAGVSFVEELLPQKLGEETLSEWISLS